jgi:hypothetical protein
MSSIIDLSELEVFVGESVSRIIHLFIILYNSFCHAITLLCVIIMMSMFPPAGLRCDSNVWSHLYKQLHGSC